MIVDAEARRGVRLSLDIGTCRYISLVIKYPITNNIFIMRKIHNVRCLCIMTTCAIRQRCDFLNCDNCSL